MDPKQDAVNEIMRAKARVDALRLRTESLIDELERRANHSIDNGRHALDRARQAVDVPTQLRVHPMIYVTAIVTTALSGLWTLFTRLGRRRRLQAAGLYRGSHRQIALMDELVRESSRPIARDVGRSLALGAMTLVGGLVVAAMSKQDGR